MSTAGWWKGAEIEDGDDAQAKREERVEERELIWKAFCDAGVAEGDPPAPEQGEKAVDAAIGFVAATPCEIKLIALEDALAVSLQPNVPGTTTREAELEASLYGERRGYAVQTGRCGAA